MTVRDAPDRAEENAPPGLAPLWRRVPELFFSPGNVMEGLAARPVWFAAYVLGCVFVIAGALLIPAEVYEESFRAIALESGREFPDDFGARARALGAATMPIVWLLLTFLYSLVAFVTFVFLFGDEGQFKQYLSAASHSLLIPALGSVVLAPLKIISGDLRMTISPGAMLGGILPPGYLLNVLKGIDLFVLLAIAVLAIGATKIDRRRTWGSAFIALFIFAVAVASLMAVFQ